MKYRLLYLAFFLIVSAFYQTSAQTEPPPPEAITPLKVEIERQADSPLTLVLQSVDSSAGRYHLIDYSIQNLSQKSIRTYVTTNSRGRSSTSFFRSPMVPGHVTQEEDREEDSNFGGRPRMMTLSVDYVLFTDGTAWGKDTRGRAVEIEGYWDGTRAAVARARVYLENKMEAELTKWLASEGNESDAPGAMRRRDEPIWQVGYNLGHRSMFHTLRKESNENAGPKLLERLKAIEKSVE